MIDTKDRIAGVIFGTACGDALGYPVEFWDMKQILARYPSGLTEFIYFIAEDSNGSKSVAPYSDDTQMMRAVFEGLLRMGKYGSMQFDDWIAKSAEEVAEEFIAWSKDRDNNRSPGQACMAGCRRLAEGVPWNEAGAPDAKGCGAAMRSMAYGIWAWDNFGLAAALAGAHAKLTHGHPSAQASAAAVAAGVACAIRGGSYADPDTTASLMMTMAASHDLETANVIGNARSAAKIWKETRNPRYSPREILDEWRGWTGDEAVAASLYCMLLSPDDYETAVLRAVNSPGDSDSLGAITGALVGARVGFKGIPDRFTTKIEKADQLQTLVDRVAAVVPT